MDPTSVAVDAIYNLAGKENPINTEPIYAIVHLTNLTVATFSTWGEYIHAIDVALKGQLPYMTFHKKPRNGHIRAVWQPAETRYFDPRR